MRKFLDEHHDILMLIGIMVLSIVLLLGCFWIEKKSDGHGVDTAYIYKCDKCGKRIEVHDIMDK